MSKLDTRPSMKPGTRTPMRANQIMLPIARPVIVTKVSGINCQAALTRPWGPCSREQPPKRSASRRRHVAARPAS